VVHCNARRRTSTNSSLGVWVDIEVEMSTSKGGERPSRELGRKMIVGHAMIL